MPAASAVAPRVAAIKTNNDPFHRPKIAPEAPIVGVKRDDEVIGALAAGPRVLRLDRLDERARKLEVVSSANSRQVGGVEPGGSRLGVSTSNVAREVTEA